MASVNIVILLGNITRDIEVRYTPKGTAVAQIGLAINKVWYDDNNNKKEEVTFVDVTLWGKNAENCAKFCRKGFPIHIEGALKLETWDDREGGQKRSKIVVTADRVNFLKFADDENAGGQGGGNGGGNRSGGYGGNRSQGQPQGRQPQQSSTPSTGPDSRREQDKQQAPDNEPDYSNEEDDDIPF